MADANARVKAKLGRCQNCRFPSFLSGNGKVVYEALEDRRINVQKVRAATVSAILAHKREDEPLSIAVDTTNVEKP